jgi:hypothetical protein
MIRVQPIRKWTFSVMGDPWVSINPTDLSLDKILCPS